MKANDVFISYSSKNSSDAVIIRQFLQSYGINCWMAPESIPAGSNYTKEIPYGILYSKLAVLVLSRDSLNSVWVNQEVTYLLDVGKTIIPFIVENIDNHPMLASKPFSLVYQSDIRIQNKDTNSLAKLLNTIQKQLGKITSFRLPDCSDDYLQLGLKDLVEDGGMLMDNGKAEYYLRKASDMGNITAMRYLAMLIHSEGSEKDAQIWWEAAAAKGDVPSIVHEVRRILNKHDNYENNLKRATELLMTAIVDNDPEACTLYAECIVNPLNYYHLPKYLTRAIHLLKNALEKGYLHAGTILGDIYKAGKIVVEDPQKAFYYYQRASVSFTEQEAILKTADCYFEGYGVKKNLKLAYQRYAAFCFHSEEYIEKFADCLNFGYGVDIDKNKALTYYRYILIGEEETLTKRHIRVLRKRFALGDSESACILGDISFNNEKYNDAYNYYNMSASNNNPQGYKGLGKCYLYGYGVEHDVNKAYLLFSKAYSMKNQEAARYLVECYKYGIGTVKNNTFEAYFEEVQSQDKDGLWNLSFLISFV